MYAQSAPMHQRITNEPVHVAGGPFKCAGCKRRVNSYAHPYFPFCLRCGPTTDPAIVAAYRSAYVVIP